MVVVPLPGLLSVVPPLGRSATAPHVPLVEPFVISGGTMRERRSLVAAGGRPD